MGNAAIAIQLLLGLLDRATQITSLLDRVRKEKRDVSQSELDTLFAADDAARHALQTEINRQKIGGG